MTCTSVEEYFALHPEPSDSVLRYILILFAIICVFGSSVNLLAIIKSRDFTPHLLLVASLSVADIMVFMETGLYLTILNRSTDKIRSCQVDSMFLQTGVMVSIISFGLITLERYLVICYEWHNHERKTIAAIALCWLVSVGITLPLAFDTKYLTTVLDIGCHIRMCSRDLGPIIINVTLMTLLLLFMCLVVYCPYQIFKLYANLRDRKRERKENQKKIFIKLGIITITFVVMYTPLTINMLYEMLTGTTSTDLMKNFYAFFVGLNSAANPILFYLLDPSIKSRVDSMLGVKALRIASSSSNVNLQQKTAPTRQPTDKDGASSLKTTVKL